MKNSDLEAWGARAAAWSASYLDTLGSRPVRPQTRPGEAVSYTHLRAHET